MTDRIGQMFALNKKKGRKSLITFVTAGDPDIGATKDLVIAMERAGADLVELGVPFSDPVAEGPVIQQANVRALSRGLKLEGIFQAVGELRKQTQIPIVFLMYINSIFHFGAERFFARCREAGVDGVIVPDLPFEEKGEVDSFAKAQGVKLISLVAPTSHDRVGMIAKQAEGFLYCVSSLGVTGERKNFDTDFEGFFRAIRSATQVPTALGFGISTPAQAAALKKYADGIIVGSAVVRLVGAAENTQAAVTDVSAFVRSLRQALDAEE